MAQIRRNTQEYSAHPPEYPIPGVNRWWMGATNSAMPNENCVPRTAAQPPPDIDMIGAKAILCATAPRVQCCTGGAERGHCHRARGGYR